MTTIEYTFEWPAGPKEVIVTGEFDDWKGTLPLVKSSTGAFELTFPVKIPSDRDRIFFKFIVDGDWVTSDAYNKGYDEHSGIENNYISETEAEALSENPAEAMIPEAGGLPFVAAAATGAVKTKEVGKSQNTKEVSKTVDPVEPTPTEKIKGPTPGATPQPPVNTSVTKPEAKTNKASAHVAESEPEQIRFKIVRRVRKNRKTGEITVLSEEKIPLGPDEATPEASIVHEEEYDHPEPEQPVPEHPLPTKAVAEQGNSEEAIHILPIDDSAQGGQSARDAVISGAGPVIPNNASEIKEFKEVRDVDAKALNDRLNAEVEGVPDSLDPKNNISASKDEIVGAEPLKPTAVTEEVKKVEEKPAPAAVPSKTPVTAAPSKTAAKKPSTKPAAASKTEEKKKKTGFFSKLKKIFQ